MCSFVFIKEAHPLPAVSSVPWRSTGAVPLREAALAAPLIAPEGHVNPGKRSSAVTAISLVPVSYLALPSSPALPSSRSPLSSLSLPQPRCLRQPPALPPASPAWAARTRQGIALPCRQSGTSGLLLRVSQRAQLRRDHHALPSASSDPHPGAQPASHCPPIPFSPPGLGM